MTRFIIKVEYNYTDLIGEKVIYYYGKRGKDVSRYNRPNPLSVDVHGFKTKASAVKAFKIRKESAEHNTAIKTVELVEVEVQAKGDSI